MQATEQSFILDPLKSGQLLMKFKLNGRSYSRMYYLLASEDAIYYSKRLRKSKHEACIIRDIDEIRSGFTTAVWKQCLDKGKITPDKSSFVFSILYDNNRHSLDLLAETEQICSQWVEGLNYLINRYRSHSRTYYETTEQWIGFLFSHADHDHSNSLNLSEIERLLSPLNIKLNEGQIRKYFQQANIRTDNHEQLTHLDREEFLLFYKFISHRPELLQIICRINGSTSEQTTATLSDYNVIKTLPSSTPLEHPHAVSSISFRKLTKKSIFSKFYRRGRSLSTLPQKFSSSSDAAVTKSCLTVEQLKNFLEDEQHMEHVSSEDSSSLIERFEPSEERRKHRELSVDGFRLLLLHDEFCILNNDRTRRVYHDMSRPITDYFIATSHNTYIHDHQAYGHCTSETFIHALRTGCRAVEMDCYDGETMEPIVYHGKTLTKPITFQEAISAIETQAFSISPYPLFLNIENHCSYEQQGVMARHLKEVFQDHLLSEALVEEFEFLPSPEELKYKVIVRSRRHAKEKSPEDSKSDEAELHAEKYHPDFANLIIYSHIVSFNDAEHTSSTGKCFHSFSFKESKIDHLIHAHTPKHLKLIKLSNEHLLRVYPSGKRQNSSNLDPMSYWTYGIQMVALNYQSDDETMWLQQGFFSDNGGCGYRLKPVYLSAHDQIFDPKEKVRDQIKYLHIHIISAQHLPKEKDAIEHRDIVDPYVEVVTHGIQCDRSKHRTPTVRNNGLNPIWDYKINLNIYCPDLCVVMFEVRDQDRLGRSTFLGQACIPFVALECGYRHIQLRAKNGDCTHGTLFVHVKIE